MGLVSDTLPGFVNGVSQQAASIRRIDQCEVMENCHATIADGLLKRPNSDLVKALGSLGSGTLKVHSIIRDADEEYIVTVDDSGATPIRIFDLDGTEQTVQYGTLDADLNFSADSAVKDYLIAGGITKPLTQIKMTSIADYTIVLNTQKVTALTTTQGAARLVDDDLNYVWVKRFYQGKYKVYFRWTESAADQSLNYGNTMKPDDVDGTEDVAGDLENGLGSADTGNLFAINQKGSMIWAYPNDAAVDAGSFYIDTSDPYGEEAMFAINNGEVNSISELPPQLPFDDVIKIGGDSEIAQDDYYFRFDKDRKVWYETVGPGLYNEIDEDTMPHRLVRTAANTFTFAPCIWDDRTVGDDTTNPAPSFIGNTLNNVAFHKNRLWFLSEDNVIGSKAGDFFNYYKSTVMDILDDDPIDIAGSGEEVMHWRSAIGFDKGLLLLSDNNQMALTAGDQLFTSKTVALDPTTKFEIDPDVNPVKIGPDVFFVSPKESYIAIREYGIQPDTLIQDAADITAHVPKYLKKGDMQFEACNLLDMLFVNNSTEPNTIYVYKFTWVGNDKVQSSWSKWTWESSQQIEGMKVFGTVLYLLLWDTDNGYKLEKIKLENLATGSQSFRYHLDHLHSPAAGTFVDPTTEITLDYEIPAADDWDDYMVIDASDNSDVSSAWSLNPSRSVIYATGDFSGGTYYVGRKYTSTYQFSEWYPKDAEKQSILQGRLQLRTMSLSFKDTGYFQIAVTPFNRDDTLTHTVTSNFTGIKVGEATVGAVTLYTGEHRFLVMAKSKQTVIKLTSDSYLPFAIQMGAWEGTWNIRSSLL